MPCLKSVWVRWDLEWGGGDPYFIYLFLFFGSIWDLCSQTRDGRDEGPLEKEMAIHSSVLVWKSHGQRSLAGYSPWGRKSVEHDLVTKQQQIAPWGAMKSDCLSN